jgi:nitronate monooxygenase
MSTAALTPVIGEGRIGAGLRNTEIQVITWPDHRLMNLLGIELPIIQAPMAGSGTAALAIAVAEAGGLGSLACALLSPDQARAEFATIRQRTSKPINVNFFCHAPPTIDPAREAAWRRRLRPYYVELGLDPEMGAPVLPIASFGSPHCDLVAELKPEIVSFHFGLPREDLLSQVKATGAKILSSATTVKEAVWLEQQGCDAIIAQGFEAGGHRGMFLSDTVATQVGTMALVPSWSTR